MFGWFRGLRESDRRILKRLERDYTDLSADVTLVSERLIRLDARLRKRASRGLELISDDGSSDRSGEAGYSAPAGDPARMADIEGHSEVSMTKEQLRDIARSRGMLPARRNA